MPRKDDESPTVSPASMPEIREDFGSQARTNHIDSLAAPVPADFETERAVLASLLAEPESMNTAQAILSGLQEVPGQKKKKSVAGDEQTQYCERMANLIFKDPKHQCIYQAILAIHLEAAGKDQNEAKQHDLLTVSDRLKKARKLDIIGGMDYLIQLQNSIPSTANLESWCQILRDYAMLRQIIGACKDTLDLCNVNSETSVRSLLEGIEAKLFAVRSNFADTSLKPFSALLMETLTFFHDVTMHKTETGIPTGYPDLDRMTGGLKPGEMVVLAARPSIGKTAIALNIVRNIIMKDVPEEQRKRVAFFSLEMSDAQVVQRLLCTEAGVSLSDIVHHNLKPGDINRLSAVIPAMQKAKLFIDPTGGLSVFELRAKARKLKETHGIDLIAIDYLTLMHADVKSTDGRQVEVAAISGGLKKLAKDLGVPILVLAQLNREIEKTAGKSAKPKLSHLRESGAIEQDADVVIFLHRDRDETKDASEQANREGVDAELIVEKNRNGSTGSVPLKFFPKLMEFRSVTHKFEKSDASPEKNA